MPLIIVALSYALYPITHPRYALPAVASFAPAVASIVALIPDVWLLATFIVIIMLGVDGLSDLRVASWEQEKQINSLIHSIRRYVNHHPVLFESSHELYVVCRYAPDLTEHCFGLDFQPGQLGRVDDHHINYRDLLRIFVRFYPPPTLMSWEAARSLPKRYIVPSVVTLRQGFSDSEQRYYGFTARLIEGQLYELIPVNQ
jgi:hypothetical protein